MIMRTMGTAFVIAAVLVFSGSAPAAVEKPAKVTVMATIFPLFEFAQAVGGDRAEVSLLIPPGADVHSWRPRLGDIKKMAGDLRLFLYVGAALEPWAEDLVKNAAGPRLRTLAASQGLDLIEEAGEEHGEHGEADPHVWLDFVQDLVIIDRIAAVMEEIAPAEASNFKANAEAYKAKLRALHDRYAETLAGCRGRRLVVGGHAAFAYLARRYGLVQTAVYGPSPDSAPAPRELVRIVAEAKAEKVKTVFYEPSVGDRLARILAAEIGADTRLLNPGHNLASPSSGGETFLDLMDRNLESLRHGLGCR
jgi:zinc transport system substrate-binding protein